jgi:hypothetical protein
MRSSTAAIHKDDVRRSEMLKPGGIHYLVSGVWNVAIV